VLERYTRWLAFSTVALMVFTAIYAVAFIYWVYIDERAYLTIEAKSVDVWEVGKPTEVSVVVQNVGKTPAYHLGIQSVMVIAQPGPIDWSRFNADSSHETLLAQGQPLSLWARATTPLDQAGKDKVEAGGDVFLVLAIEVSYDTFFFIPLRQRDRAACSGTGKETGSPPAYFDHQTAAELPLVALPLNQKATSQ
jgi:hypothetical protein